MCGGWVAVELVVVVGLGWEASARAPLRLWEGETETALSVGGWTELGETQARRMDLFRLLFLPCCFFFFILIGSLAFRVGGFSNWQCML